MGGPSTFIEGRNMVIDENKKSAIEYEHNGVTVVNKGGNTCDDELLGISPGPHDFDYHLYEDHDPRLAYFGDHPQEYNSQIEVQDMQQMDP